jgi:hypothetical protein
MVAPEDKEHVRAAVIGALRSGQVEGPERLVRWELVDTAVGELSGEEDALAERLNRS